MPQGTLSAANVIQAKTGFAAAASPGDPVTVSLDSPCLGGSTVLLEVTLGGLPIMDGGLGAVVPDGFAFDGSDGAPYCNYFRKPEVAAGEQSWQFHSNIPTDWGWRVTEWDAGLDPISPLEILVSAVSTGSAPTTQTTGTTTQNGRANAVCLAWHFANLTSAASGSWSGHTNGFSERDELSVASGTTWWVSSWSWAFAASPAQFECTATLSGGTRSASDSLVGMAVVYAATTYS